MSNLKTRMDTLEFAFDSIARERGKKNFEEWKKQLTGNVFDYKQAKELEIIIIINFFMIFIYLF